VQENETLFTVQQIADKLQVNYRTILDRIHLGEIDAYKIGGAYRISLKQLNTFLENNKYESYWKGKLK